MNALDLFAGPGGWDVGARELGIHPLGIENDDAACATRDAAGLSTVVCDVSAMDPANFYVGEKAEQGCDLLIASPPCQAWSMAGKREGYKDIVQVFNLTRKIAGAIGQVEDFDWADERSKLVTEPLRWSLALRPRFIAWEQVPPVLDYWRFCAEILRDQGYSVWTGILSAERYGVPQTRKRAILMASLDGAVEPPRPTHQAYVAGEPAWDEPQQSLEGELLPWISMAEALGWTADVPAPTVTGGGSETGGPEPFGRGGASENPASRVGFPRRADDGVATDDGYRERDFRTSDEPAPTVTEKARSWTREGEDVEGLDRRQGGAPVRSPDEPAHTQSSQGLAKGRGVWKMAKKEDRPERKEQGAGNQPRSEDQPAATVDTQAGQAEWTKDQPSPTVVSNRRSDRGGLVGRQLPKGEGRNIGGRDWIGGRRATAVCGDPRVSPPGYRGRADDYDEEGNYQGERSMDNAVRVTVEEAATLQGFPPDYPWQGSRTKQFQQIGNAVPPPLAKAILGALVGAEAEVRESA